MLSLEEMRERLGVVPTDTSKNLQSDMSKNNWQTGTPTEEGWYLFSYKYLDTIRYGTDCFLDGKWVFNPTLYEKNLAWQKIEPYKETS